MKNKNVFILVGLAAISIQAPAAHAAMAIDPQCTQMNDKIGCTCALQNGGRTYVWHGQMKWNYPKAYIDAVEKCKKAAG